MNKEIKPRKKYLRSWFSRTLYISLALYAALCLGCASFQRHGTSGKVLGRGGKLLANKSQLQQLTVEFIPEIQRRTDPSIQFLLKE